jgi:hypothetical protein
VIAPQNPAAVVALKHFTDRVQREIRKYRGSRPDVRAQRLPRTDDFARLARRICGVSIGLVLGGGGARGISHLVSHRSLPQAMSQPSQGVLRALEDNGIPIDHIGGMYIHSILIICDFIHFKVRVSAPLSVVYTRRRSTSYPVLLGQVSSAEDWVIYGESYPTSHTLSWPTQLYADIMFRLKTLHISSFLLGA